MVRFIWVMFVAILLGSCARRVVTNESEVIYKDRLVHTERIDTVLAYVNLPSENHSAVVFASDTSRLETSVAESMAWLDTAGMLHHTLKNKDKSLPVKVGTKSTSDVIEKTLIRTKTVTLEKKLSWFENIKLRSWAWVVLALGTVIVMMGYRFFHN